MDGDKRLCETDSLTLAVNTLAAQLALQIDVHRQNKYEALVALHSFEYHAMCAKYWEGMQ